MKKVLYNPKSNSGKGFEVAKKIEEVLKGQEIEFVDASKIEDFDQYVQSVPEEDHIILCGGDGSLNFYINHTSEETRQRKLGYFAAGTGNDFLRDIGGTVGELVDDISMYMQKLPTVKVNGKESLFINGIGYGIDGYCCEVGDREREKSDKTVNYTAIAIKGLLFHFKPCTATVTVDGKTETYKHVWLVPAMHGRYYGGGMMPTPDQDRNAEDKKLSFMVYRHWFNIAALILFPKIFEGKHVKNKKTVTILEGKTGTVVFDRPCALQIDGETVLDVSEYSVHVYGA